MLVEETVRRRNRAVGKITLKVNQCGLSFRNNSGFSMFVRLQSKSASLIKERVGPLKALKL